MKNSRQSMPVMPALFALLVALMLSACGSTGQARGAQVGGVLAAPDSANAETAYEESIDYRIGAQDLLEVSVFGVDDLAQSVRVNANGQISMPLIGSVAAGGKTVAELEALIAEELSKGYLQDPQVSVFIKEFTSQRITLSGAVNRPGIYPLTGRTTLVQALAVGNGLANLADPGGVVLFRTIDGQRMAAVYDLREITAGRMEDPVLYGDDIIVVEQSGSRTALRRILETFPILGLFRIF